MRIPQRLALALYSLVAWAATPLVRAKLRRRARSEPAYGQQVPERFGHYGTNVQPPSQGSFIWVHAVSLGETHAAALLLAQLRALLPGMHLLLTHGTATGRTEGAKLLRPGDVQVWQPWDSRAATRRFIRHFRPAIGILMETEVWPNLAAACRQVQIPLVLANARLNARSHARARRLAWLARPAYGGLAAAWAQTPADAERLRDLGAPVAAVLGNLKFDVVPDAGQHARGRAWRQAGARPVVLLASSREGEEAMWLEELHRKRAFAQAGQAQAAIKKGVQGPPGSTAPVQWLVVPRHPQRFAEVEQLCRAAGLTVSRRSQWTGVPQPADVWLGDSMGEMALYYGLAHVALLGGSFAPLGGQNLIEAAACGCPVVMGPHTFNFDEAACLAVEAGAAERVADMARGLAAALDLALDAPGQERVAQRCTAFAQAHRGTARATAQRVVQQLGA